MTRGFIPVISANLAPLQNYLAQLTVPDQAPQQWMQLPQEVAVDVVVTLPVDNKKIGRNFHATLTICAAILPCLVGVKPPDGSSSPDKYMIRGTLVAGSVIPIKGCAQTAEAQPTLDYRASTLQGRINTNGTGKLRVL